MTARDDAWWHAQGARDGQSILSNPDYREGDPVPFTPAPGTPQAVTDAYVAGVESVLGKGNVTVTRDPPAADLGEPDTGVMRLDGDMITRPWRYR